MLRMNAASMIASKQLFTTPYQINRPAYLSNAAARADTCILRFSNKIEFKSVRKLMIFIYRYNNIRA